MSSEDLPGIGVTDGFTLAAVGDCITSRPLVPTLQRDAGFANAIDILRDATTTFGNLETSVIDIRGFRGSPRTWGDWDMAAPPTVIEDLIALGFDIVSRANNHGLDWGIEGLRETARHLDDAGLVHAGAGEVLASARAARYVETAGGRVGLVSLAPTGRFDPAAALDQFGEVPGRPGINALRVRQTFTVPPDQMTGLRELGRLMDPAAMGQDLATRPGADHLSLFEARFEPGDELSLRYEVDAGDLAANLRSIRLGKQHSDLVVVSAHVHEEGPGPDRPPPFLIDVAHAAIDAGADVFVGHGIHRMWPIEIYEGRPIFYGLGNFIFSDIQEPVTRSLYEEGRDLLEKAGVDPSRATDADVSALLNAQGFDDDRYFESIIAQVAFEGGRAASLRLHPVDLGRGKRLTESGIPRIAEPERGADILKRLAAMSEPFGTSVAADGGVGVVTIP
ncbi:MAG: CapA family protein [Actinomycetota bacterium]